MSFVVYVSGYVPETTLEDLIIYFQSKESSGGDIDDEKCHYTEKETLIVFEEEEDQQRVLGREHCLNEKTIKVSNKKPRKTKEKSPNPKSQGSKTKGSQSDAKDDKKPIIGEITTVIVTGINPETKEDTLKYFFENTRRSGGGEIKDLKRIQPDIAHVTFFAASVANNVLKKDRVEIDGYLLKLEPQKPKVTFPPDKKKLFIENINPKTTKDSLTNYVELITKQLEVKSLMWGKKNDVMVTLSEETDINHVIEKAKTKPLERALLKITQPPVCNSILITGISENTTKDSLELRFENPKYGGGEILDAIYQRSEGKAIISFLDQNVLESITKEKHTWNGATLTIRPCYPFMEDLIVDEIEKQGKTIKVNQDIMHYVSNICDEEFSELFDLSTSKLKYDEEKEEVTIIGKKEIDKIQDYFNQFEVKEIPVPKKIITKSKDDVEEILNAMKENDKNKTHVELDEGKQCIIVTGKRKKVTKCEKEIRKKLSNLEKINEIITTNLSLEENKLILMYVLEFGVQFDSQPNIAAKISPQDGVLELQGSAKLVNDAKMKALLLVSEMKEENMELNDRQVEFLDDEGLSDINKSLKKMKSFVCLDKSRRRKAKVVYINPKGCEDIVSFIKEKIFEQCCTLEEESVDLLQSQTWVKMKDKLSKEMEIKISVNERNVWLTGEKSKVQQAHHVLKEFIKKNTIVSESISFDDGTSRYLKKHCKDKIHDIELTLKEHMVNIDADDDGTLRLRGTKDGAIEAKKKLQSIVGKLKHDTISIEQPGLQKHFQSVTGKAALSGIESDLQCTITVTNNKENRLMQVLPVNNQLASMSTSQLLCTYETPEKVLLKVYRDDITEHKCDVIVNAANGNLQHVGGLAKAIVDKGGKEIQDDCDGYQKSKGSLLVGQFYKGIPGKLPCKNIIHLVGPTWNNFDRVKHENYLRYGCEQALESAMNDKVIAFPGVGSGIFGVPKNVCARVMVEAAVKFTSTNGKKSSLREIHFVNNDKPTAHAFLDEFKNKFRNKATYVEVGARLNQKIEKRNDRGILDDDETTSFDSGETPSRRLTGDSIITKTQTISVVVGDLATHQADVLVNTTGQDLNLSNNPCGKALSNEAGPQLQKECNKVGRLKVGEVAMTPGGNLLCKHVCHVVCTQYNNGQGEQILRSIVQNCLHESDSRGYKSIAFPAIGTGVLGFPHKVAAKICFEEVKRYAQKKPNTSLKDVQFVVYHQDKSSIKAFKDEIRNQPEWNQVSSSGVQKGPSRRELRKPVESNEQQQSTTPTINDEKGGGISLSLKDGGKICVFRGDITEEKTDVIAHLSNPDGSMNGGVAKAILRKGGKEIGKLRMKKKSVSMYDTVLTKAGTLPAKYIAHMAGPDGPDCKDIKKCVTSCLQEVTNQQCQSISFPAIGTGQLNMAPKESAEAMLTAIVAFLQENPGLIETVHIIIHDKEVFIKFSNSVKKILSGQDHQSPGMLRSVINGIWNYFKSDTTEPTADNERTLINPPMFLNVCTEKQEAIKKVKEKIEIISKEQMKSEIVDNEQIEKLTETQEAKINSIAKKYNVEVKIEKQITRMVVNGHAEDVSKVMTEVNAILNDMKLTEHEKETADILFRNVQWYWIDDTEDEVPYDKGTNSLIEKAYSKKEKSISFTLKEGECKINFDQMIERNQKTAQVTKVSRKDLNAKGGASVPDYWDPQPKDSNGKEKPVHIVQLDPTKHKEEYKKVIDGFKQTAPNQPIIKIERIQNPMLYKLYAIKKLGMDERHGSNEKILYHGTATSNVDEINQNGLNRSYKGLAHGTAHGHGIYFARDASMSAGYAPATAGQRAMYVVRVAVGQYAKSSSSMIVPPPLSTSQNDKYDSVVDNVSNPTIFVLFYDNQYYPEYLITFR